MINHVLIILIPEPGYSTWQAAQESEAITSLYYVLGTYADRRSIFSVTEHYLLEQNYILDLFYMGFYSLGLDFGTF